MNFCFHFEFFFRYTPPFTHLHAFTQIFVQKNNKIFCKPRFRHPLSQRTLEIFNMLIADDFLFKTVKAKVYYYFYRLQLYPPFSTLSNVRGTCYSEKEARLHSLKENNTAMYIYKKFFILSFLTTIPYNKCFRISTFGFCSY